MKTLKRYSIQLGALLGLLLLAACAASSPTMATEVVLAPTSTSTSVPPTNTPRPMETPLPTPTRVLTRTPVPRIVKTTQALTATDPITQEIESYLMRLHVSPDAEYPGTYRVLVRQAIDINLDGRQEYFVGGEYVQQGYYAILGYTVRGWDEWYYAEFAGKYSAQTQARLEKGLLIVDALGMTGGTGALSGAWSQDWVRCEVLSCRSVWKQKMVETTRWAPLWVPLGSVVREYRIAQIEQPDTNTIRVVTRYLSNQVPVLSEKPISLTVPATMQRTVGPDVESIYHWDGQVFRLEQQTQISPGVEIDRVFDQATDETVRLINNTLATSLRDANGVLDSKKYNADQLDFWGPQAAKQAVDDRWVQTFANAAAHTGTAEELGEWIGAVSSSEQCHPVRKASPIVDYQCINMKATASSLSAMSICHVR